MLMFTWPKKTAFWIAVVVSGVGIILESLQLTEQAPARDMFHIVGTYLIGGFFNFLELWLIFTMVAWVIYQVKRLLSHA